jgi:hypothetical protein
MKKITLLLCSFLLVSAVAFCNNDTFFFENDIFTVVKKSINNNVLAFKDEESSASSLGLDLDGGDDKIIVPYSASLGNFTEMTIEFWINPSNYSWKTILGTPNKEWGVAINGNDNKLFFWNNDTSINHGSNTAVIPNTWQHFAIVRSNTTNTIQYYLNGVDIGLISNMPDFGQMQASGNLGIGAEGATTTNGWNFIAAKLDELRIWNVSRSQAEIQNNMNSSLGGSEAGLVAYYKMEDGTGSSVMSDATSYGNDGNLINMDPANDWVAGYSAAADPCDNDVTNPTASNPVAVNVECTTDVPAVDIEDVIDEADNCAGAITVAHVSDVSDENFNPEVITRTYSVTDESLNTINVTQTITVEDVTNPAASNPVAVNVECAADVPAVDIEDVIDEADNCAGAITVAHVSDVSAGFNPEVITRMYSVTDASLNTINVTQTIIVEDVTNPTASNLVAVNVECATDVPAVDIEDVIDEADNCAGTITVVHVGDVSDGLFNPEVITRTYSVTDASLNTINVTQTIIVEDVTNPTASNPVAVNVECATDVPAVDIEDVIDEADNCAGTITVVHVGDVSDGLFNPEVITRTYSVTDASLNTINVTQTITVEDTIIPVTTLVGVNPQIIDINTAYTELGATAIDNCDGNVVVNIDDSAIDATTVGSYVVTYDVSDSSGNNAIQKTRTVFVLEEGKPWAQDDTFSLNQDTTNNSFTVVVNDSFGTDGQSVTHPLTVGNGRSSSASSEGGRIVINGLNVNYTPKAGFSGEDTFNYTITDASGDASTATVTVTVLEVLLGHTADTATVNQDTTDNIIDVKANDADNADFGLNDTRFLIVSVDHLTGTTTNGGTVSLETYNTLNDTSDDVILYTPAAGFSGTDTFNYVPGNMSYRNSLVLVTVTVEAVVSVNGTPTAANDAVTVSQNSLDNSIAVLDDNTHGADSFGTDGQSVTHPLTIGNGRSSSASSEGGRIVVNGLTIDYTPKAGFSGVDTFNYTITDASGDASSATVTVTVGAAVTVLTAVADSFTVDEDSSDNDFDVTDNDTLLGGGSISTFEAASAEGGSIVLNGGNLEYTPFLDFTGTDTFNYTITNGTDPDSSATVTVTVEAVVGVNGTPTAANDAVTVSQNSLDNSIAVLDDNTHGADSFGTDGQSVTHPLTVGNGRSSSASSEGGRIVVNGLTIDYTPKAGFTGVDTFNYTITDKSGDASSATVTVTVGAAVTVLTAVADSFTVDEDSSDNDFDVTDNDTLLGGGSISTFEAASAEGGSIVLNGGNLEYTPFLDFTGTDTFNYTITNGTDPDSSATVTVTVEAVVLPNDLPTAVDDSFTINRTVANAGDIFYLDVTGNDNFGNDGRNATHALRLTNGKSDTASTGGRRIKFHDNGTPADLTDDRIAYYSSANPSFTSDTFIYTITDGNGDASTATVTVTLSSISAKSTSGANTNGNATIKDTAVLVYPNPSSGFIKTVLFSNKAANAKVSLFDVTGKVVYSSVVNLVQGKNELELNLDAKPGILFLKISSSELNYEVSKIVFK